MRRKLGPKSMKALEDWIGPRTWDSDHSNDWDRWYIFVDVYLHEHRKPISDLDLRQQIVQMKPEIQDNEILLAIVRKHVSVAQHIREFMRVTR